MDNRFDNTKSLGGNIWKFAGFDENAVELVAARYGLPPVVAQIMVSRGIDIGQSNDFLYPKLQNLMPDPACLKDMEKAVSILKRKLTENKRPSSAIMTLTVPLRHHC